jgi:UTP:GlnB (protein PII) uridylyltransferase
VLARLGVADADAEIVVRLVREHLTLIELATRRDLERSGNRHGRVGGGRGGPGCL